MKKHFKGFVLGALLTAFVLPTAVSAQGATWENHGFSVKLSDSTQQILSEAVIINGQTVYPIRVLATLLGFTVQWNPDSDTIICFPNKPQKPDNTPEGSPEAPEVTPDIPESTPDVPENTPNVPENTPDVPENTPSVPEEKPEAPSPEVSSFAVRVFELTNQERRNAGLAPFEWSDDLAAVAYAHSKDMAERNFFSHNNPDGETPFDRMRSYGIRYSYAAENIAMGQRTPEAVVQGWMNSEGHRANILNPNLTHLGVGFYRTSGGTPYWTQNFCTPR